jgi:hypothetical protein
MPGSELRRREPDANRGRESAKAEGFGKPREASWLSLFSLKIVGQIAAEAQHAVSVRKTFAFQPPIKLRAAKNFDALSMCGSVHVWMIDAQNSNVVIFTLSTPTLAIRILCQDFLLQKKSLFVTSNQFWFRTVRGPRLERITIMTQHLETFRKSVLFQPQIKLGSSIRPFAVLVVHVIDGEGIEPGLAARTFHASV